MEARGLNLSPGRVPRGPWPEVLSGPGPFIISLDRWAGPAALSQKARTCRAAATSSSLDESASSLPVHPLSVNQERTDCFHTTKKQQQQIISLSKQMLCERNFKLLFMPAANSLTNQTTNHSKRQGPARPNPPPEQKTQEQ